MIKKMNGWKVISNHRTSARACNWDQNRKKWCLKYPVGKTVFPNVKHSKIMFFKDFNDALAFAGLVRNYVVKCVATNVTKPKYVCSQVPDMQKFWSRKKAKKSVGAISMKAPFGTYWAESIKCIE